MRAEAEAITHRGHAEAVTHDRVEFVCCERCKREHVERAPASWSSKTSRRRSGTSKMRPVVSRSRPWMPLRLYVPLHGTCRVSFLIRLRAAH